MRSAGFVCSLEVSAERIPLLRQSFDLLVVPSTCRDLEQGDITYAFVCFGLRVCVRVGV